MSRATSLASVKGFQTLNKAQQIILGVTYKKHCNVMDKEERKKYKISSMKEVRYDRKENVIKVSFGQDTYHYGQDFTWY